MVNNDIYSFYTRDNEKLIAIIIALEIYPVKKMIKS